MQLHLTITIVLVVNAMLLVIVMWLSMTIIIHETQRVKLTNKEKKLRKLVNLNKQIQIVMLLIKASFL